MSPNSRDGGGQKTRLIAHKYVDGQKQKLKDVADRPNLSAEDIFHRSGQAALLNGETSTRYRAEFFDQIFIDILSDHFKQWLLSAPEEVKKREYLYQSAMALGSVKETILRFEMFGKNIAQQAKQATQSQEGEADDSATE
jgi:hypothetical protein